MPRDSASILAVPARGAESAFPGSLLRLQPAPTARRGLRFLFPPPRSSRIVSGGGGFFGAHLTLIFFWPHPTKVVIHLSDNLLLIKIKNDSK